ncbi:rRNA maturation RNase YbeY [Candidatus Liberibacter africanus]|nr:rRNA maturation RNase YbeY [Candidatus Liberibacter africanus]
MNRSKLDLQIAVESELWSDNVYLYTLCEVVFTKAISFLISKRCLGKEDVIEISLVFTDSRRSKELNREYIGIDKPTNVLSFPLSAEYSHLMLGDIILAYEVIKLESNVLEKKFEDHLVHLMVHGFLHLLGYDHVSDDDACLMEGLERSILGNLGIDDPYEMD